MRRTNRFLRLMLVVMILFAVAPGQFAYAADPNAPAIAAGLRSFGRTFTGLGESEALAAALPLTALSIGGAEGLRLSTIFRESLTDKLTGSYDSLDALSQAITGLSGDYGGVRLDFLNSVVQQNGTQIDVRFSVRARRTVTPPLVVEQPPVSLNGGAQTINLELLSDLAFQLNLVDRQPGRDFYLVGAPTMQVHAQAAGPIAAFADRLGFAGVNVSGTTSLNVAVAVALRDPDHDGHTNQEEWETTALTDLLQIDVVDEPGDAVNATLMLEALPIPDAATELIPGSPDGRITQIDDDLRNGLNQPTLALGALADFANITPADMLRGLSQLSAALLTAQATDEPRLPFLNQRLSDAFHFADPLIDVIHRQGDAAILCGVTDTNPPTGDIARLHAGDTIYCRAITLQAPRQVDWRIANSTGVVNGDALATVGTNPSANASFTLTAPGSPQIELRYAYPSDPAGEMRLVTPLVRTAQELFAQLSSRPKTSGPNVRNLGGFDMRPDALHYDPATASLTYHLTYHLTAGTTPPPVRATPDFGNQLLDATRLSGLRPTAADGVMIQPRDVQFDLTFGVILVSNPADIAPGATAVDRFFVQVRDGAGEHEFSANVDVDATVDLEGMIGFVKVGARGDAIANTVDKTAFTIAAIDPAQPMLALDIVPSADGIPIAGRTPIARAIRVTQLFSPTLGIVQPTFNMRMSAGLRVSAVLGDPPTEIGSGRVAIAWAHFPQGAPTATTDADFARSLQALDIDPANPRALLSLALNGLDALANRLGAIDSGQLGARLPLVGIRPKELVTQFDQLQAATNHLRTNPPASLQDLERALEQELGIAPAALSFALEELPAVRAGRLNTQASDAPRSLVIRLGYGICSRENVIVVCPPGAKLDDKRDVHLRLENGSVGTLVGAAADLKLEYAAQAQLDLGVPLDPSISLGDVGSHVIVLKSSGISVTSGLQADGIGLRASVGPIAVLLGTQATNGDGTPGASSLRLNVGVAMRNASADAFTIDDFVAGLQAQIAGPAAPLDCGTFNGSAGPRPLSGAACARLAVGIGLGDSAVSIGEIGFELKDVNRPDQVFIEFPPAILNQINTGMLDWRLLFKALPALSRLAEQKLNGAASKVHAPLVGDALTAGADVAGAVDQTAQVLDTLGDSLHFDGNTPVSRVEQQLRDGIFQAINGIQRQGASVASAEAPAGLLPSRDDIDIQFRCNGNTCEPTVARALDVDDVQVSFPIGENSQTNPAFDLALPGLPLTAKGTLVGHADWTARVAFGLSRSDGPYLFTGGATPELQLHARVALGDATDQACAANDPDIGDQAPGLQGYSPTRCLMGRLGFLEVSLRDGVSEVERTQLALTTTLDLTGANDKLPLADLTSDVPELKPAIVATANVNLRLRTTIASAGASMPSVLGAFHLTWNTADGAPTRIAFDNLYLDAGTFASTFLRPIASQIKKVTSPIKPVIDTLKAPLPVLSDVSRMTGGDDITLFSLLEQVSSNDLSLISKILDVMKFADQLASAGDADSTLIPLGELLNAQQVRLSDINDNAPGAFLIDAAQVLAGPVAPDQVGTIIHPLSSRSAGLLNAVTQSSPSIPSSLTFPFLEDSTRIFGLLLGQDVTFIRFDAGVARGTASIRYDFPPIFVGPIPIGIGFGGSVTLEGRFAMGYDSAGLRQFVDQPDAGNLLKGIYIDDLDGNGNDVPEISLIGAVSVYAGVDALLVSAGVEGGIRLTVGLNLHDSGAIPDGKLRFNEIAAHLRNPICLFDVEGKLAAFLGAYVRVGFGFLSETFRFDIAEVTLLDFSVNPCTAEPPEPQLAHLDRLNLVLNMGPYAGLRGVFNDPDTDKDEQFVVRQLTAVGAAPFDPAKPCDQVAEAPPGTSISDDAPATGTRVSIAAFGLYQECTLPFGGQIVGYGDTGNDVISLQPGIDPLGQIVPFTVKGELHGGLDNDQLVGGDADDVLYGDDGNDQIDGGAGADIIEGGAGDDVLDGKVGDDLSIDGGDGNDVVSGGPGADTLSGGAGDDQLFGGPGSNQPANPQTGTPELPGKLPDLNDTIEGGPGNDIIDGGFGDDSIYGDEKRDGTDDQQCQALGDTAPPSDDSIQGGPGADHIFGGAGNDHIAGGDGNDRLCGNGGDDFIDGDAESLSARAGDDTLDGGAGDDALYGRAGDDDLFGRAGIDKLYGEDGNDDLSGGLGTDRLEGAAGRDYLFGDDGSAVRPAGQPDASAVTFSETVGERDIMLGGADDDVLYGEGGGDELHGDAGQDLLYGNAGSDDMYGGADNDRMEGNDDGDRLYGDSGDDRMYGNGGDDLLRGGIGDDYAEGNQGVDTIFGDADQDDLIGGGAVASVPDMGDALDGGAQQDELAGDNAQITRPGGVTTFDGAVIRLVTLLDIDSPDATLSGGDRMFGGDGNDRMFGQGGDDLLHGDAGDDFMQGNAAADVMYGDLGQDDIIGGSDAPGRSDGADTIYGGDGQRDLVSDFDVIVGDNALIVRPLIFGAWRINLYNGSIQRQVTLLDEVFVGGTDSPTLSGDDRIMGEGGDDQIYGQGGSDLLRGGAGDDALEGGSAADTIFGDAGQDDIIGGSAAPGRVDGGDTIYGGDGQSELIADHDVIAGDNATIARPALCGQWQANRFDGSVVRNVTLFEVATVGQTAVVRGDDRIFGESGNDRVYGQGGDDTLDGGAGDDVLEGNADSDMIDGGLGNDDIVGGTGRINHDGPQGVDGRVDGRDTINGGAGFDVIAGDNAILARKLFDQQPSSACPPNSAIGIPQMVSGRWRQNSYDGGIQHDPQVLLDLNSPDSAAVGGDDIIAGDDDDDLVYGQAGDDWLRGGAGDDVLEGNAGSDTIEGGDGSDDIVGGSAQSTSFDDTPDFIRGDLGDDAIAGDNARISRPLDRQGRWKRDQASGAVLRDIRLYDVLLKGKRPDLRLSSWDSIEGGAGYDTLLGQGGDDILAGGDDSDYMEGNAGGDTMYGNGGKDRMIGGGSGADGVVGSGENLNDLIDGDDVIDGGGDGDTILPGNGVIR